MLEGPDRLVDHGLNRERDRLDPAPTLLQHLDLEEIVNEPLHPTR